MRARCSGIGRVVRRCRARSPISTLPRSRRRMQAKYVGFSTQDLTDSVSWWPGAGCGMMLCEVGVDHLSGPGIGTNGALYFSTWFGCMYHVVRASMAQGVYLKESKIALGAIFFLHRSALKALMLRLLLEACDSLLVHTLHVQ
ncbi:uncharacterized protein LOC124669838 isoform X1 [Lolium rigidum]|uniref:uncharacterized protein LOC124669838 isoform X1 n=1 Tax=Lolium rigidum TaxID=89674 RepID=UPI001F5D45FB|nr:uncharacterized protein LOC124669838 isoform X1 [Lolium rigidum]